MNKTHRTYRTYRPYKSSNSQFGRKLDKNWQKNEGRKKGSFFLPSFFCQVFDFAVHIENCCYKSYS